jgi:small conductance mechanosensitive channel
VAAVLRRIGEQVQHDPDFAPKILAPLEYIGIDSFDDSAVILKIRMKTLPIQQWGVARELRRRIKLEFDRLGIELPYPHLSIGMAADSSPLALRMAAESASPDGPPHSTKAGTAPNA